MWKPFLILGFLTPLCSSARVEIKQLPDHPLVRKLASATSWDDIITQMQPVLPALTVSEFRSAVKGIEFPSIRTYRGQLVITDSSYRRGTLSFEPYGVVNINGKAVRVRPLARTSDEIERIDRLLVPRSSALFLDSLVPSAYAAGLLGAGLSSFALAGASTWKAEACGREEIDEELAETCPLLGAKMLEKVSFKEAYAKSQVKLEPISLKCPAENGGVLEQIKRNSEGLVMRGRYYYKGSTLTRMVIEGAEPSKKFELFRDIDATNPKDDSEKVTVEKVGGGATKLLEAVCLGPSDYRARYFSMLESIRNSGKPGGSTVDLSKGTSMDAR